MLFYLPERIYNKLEPNNSNYKKLSDNVDNKKKNIKTFREYIEADNALSEKRLSELYSIKAYCRNKLKDDPILLKEYDINNGEYTKDEMIKMYNSPDETIDTENKFYLLSNIVNKAYEGTSTHTEYVEEYEKYMNEYKTLYESLDEDIIKTLSKYVWLKYMYCKVWFTCKDVSIDEENWVKNIFIKCIAIYDKQLELTNDKSITMNYFIEAICSGINNIGISGASNKDIHKVILLFRQFVDRQEFQYKECSFAYLKLMDMECQDYLISRDISSFYNMCQIIFRYISNAFKNIDNLLRGLSYYDKVNHNMWCVLVRQYIKLRDNIPLLQKIPIENISEDDYEFIIGNDLCNNVNVADPNRFSEVNFKDSVDYLLENGNGLFERINSVMKV